MMPKGTPRHKRLGSFFVAGMLLSNVVVLGIYEDSDKLGIFHVLAIISLVSLVGAIALVLWRRSCGRAWSGCNSTRYHTVADYPDKFPVVALTAYRTDFAGMLDGRFCPHSRH